MMRQRNREKKLLHESALLCRDQDEHSISQNTSYIPLEDPNDSAETEANKSNSQCLSWSTTESLSVDISGNISSIASLSFCSYPSTATELFSTIASLASSSAFFCSNFFILT